MNLSTSEHLVKRITPPCAHNATLKQLAAAQASLQRERELLEEQRRCMVEELHTAAQSAMRTQIEGEKLAVALAHIRFSEFLLSSLSHAVAEIVSTVCREVLACELSTNHHSLLARVQRAVAEYDVHPPVSLFLSTKASASVRKELTDLFDSLGLDTYQILEDSTLSSEEIRISLKHGELLLDARHHLEKLLLRLTQDHSIDDRFFRMVVWEELIRAVSNEHTNTND